jgi:hypothetical protein
MLGVRFSSLLPGAVKARSPKCIPYNEGLGGPLISRLGGRNLSSILRRGYTRCAFVVVTYKGLQGGHRALTAL